VVQIKAIGKDELLQLAGLVASTAKRKHDSRLGTKLVHCTLLVRVHFIIEMIWWTGLAPWEFEFPFPGTRGVSWGGMSTSA